MSAVQATNKQPLAMIEAIGLLLSALGAIPAYAGAMGMFIKRHNHETSTLSMIAGWNHPALLVGGIAAMAVGAVLGFAAHRMLKQ